MPWRVENVHIDEEAWADTTWNVNVQQSRHIERNSTVNIGPLPELEITVSQPSQPPLGPIGGSYTEQNGLLAAYFPAEGSAEEVGIVFSMIVLKEEVSGDIDRHITALTMEGDPDDTGVMGAEDGGDDPDSQPR